MNRLKRIRGIGGWIGWVALSGIAFYGLMTGFSLSAAGKIHGAGIATAACFAALAWLTRAGFFRKLRETASSRSSLVVGSLVVAVTFWVFSWLILARALPAVATSRFSEARWIDTSIVRHAYPGARFAGPRYAALVELPGHDSRAWFRIREAEYRQLPDTSHGQVLARQSWFGAHLLEVHLDEGLRIAKPE